MHYLIEAKVMEELERGACRLESLGTILSHLCDPDAHRTPDLGSLADLGSLISRQAMDLLELLAEKLRLQPKAVPDFPEQTRHDPSAHLATLCFVPEIPSD